MNILDTLNTIQRSRQLNDQQFSEILGIHRVSWQRIKNGRVPVSDKFLVRVNRAFPELGIFLSKDATNDSKETTQSSHEAHQDGFLTRLWGWVRDLFKR